MGSARGLGPDRIDDVLVARNSIRVGETVRVDLRENMEVGGRRGTVVRQLRGENPVQPRTQIVHWSAPELGEGTRERSADGGPRFVRGAEHTDGYVEERTEEPAVENGEVFVSPGPLLDDVHQPSEESADSRRAVGGLEGRNSLGAAAAARNQPDDGRDRDDHDDDPEDCHLSLPCRRIENLILAQTGESSATRSGDLSPSKDERPVSRRKRGGGVALRAGADPARSRHR